MVSSVLIRIASFVVLALILVGSFQWTYLRVFLVDQGELADRMEVLRFGKMPEIRGFLDEVEKRTSPGESIALVVPAPDWNRGYEYAFYRASYVLAGRTVLPVMNPAGHPLPSNLERADYIAAWRAEVDPERFDIVWRERDGVLARTK